MARSKKVLNSPENAVEEFVQGLLLQYPDRLVRVKNHHVILLRSSLIEKEAFQNSNVRLLSGGGSGHEPSHAGWIGTGMLSGAICGQMFASPSVYTILAAIQSFANSSNGQPTPILLIVKNYTGDRLNFGIAMERAKMNGWEADVRMVIVADDCALSRTNHGRTTSPRGLAGTVLVHKVAGAAAQAGKSIDEVMALALLTTQRLGTLGIALSSVTVPGIVTSTKEEVEEETIEIGLGIHGEAGWKKSPLLTADEMARVMITKIQEYGRVDLGQDGSETIVPMFQAGNELCLLVNNLGGTSNFEMSILANACVKLIESTEFGAVVTRLLVGSYMTSFNMHGASLTILNLTDQQELVEMLDAPTDAPAWLPVSIRHRSAPRPSATPIPEPNVEAIPPIRHLPRLRITDFTTIAHTAIWTATTKLIEAEPLLTKYDTIVGDGDCGITMKRGAIEVQERLSKHDQNINTDHPIPMFASLADAVSMSMGGTSGVLFELMFRKMASTLAKCDSIGKVELCHAFQAGVDVVSLYGGAQLGSRTMLDALIPAVTELLKTNNLTAAATLARQGADGTAKMKTASAGRSNYLSEVTLEGTPDPGAVAVAIILENLATGLDLQE